MPSTTFMVVIGQRNWTLSAMHLACAMARDTGGEVIVTKMVRVNHPILLGDSAGLVNYSKVDRWALQDCAATAEDYGIAFRVQVATYSDYVNGLSSVADQLGADVIFAQPGRSRIAALNRLLRWRLRRVIVQPLFTLESPEDQPVLTPPVDVAETGVEPSDGLTPVVRTAGL